MLPIPGQMRPDNSGADALMGFVSNVNNYHVQIENIALSGSNVNVTPEQAVVGVMRMIGAAAGGYTVQLPPTDRIVDALGPTIRYDGTFAVPISLQNEDPVNTATLVAPVDGRTTLVGTMTVIAGTRRIWLLSVTSKNTLTITNIGTFSINSPGGGGNALRTTDGVTTVDPTTLLTIGPGIHLSNPSLGEAKITAGNTNFFFGTDDDDEDDWNLLLHGYAAAIATVCEVCDDDWNLLLRGSVPPVVPTTGTAIAQALLITTNFKLLLSGTTQLTIPDTTSFTVTDTLVNISLLNGIATIQTKAAGVPDATPFVSPIDATMACAGGGCGAIAQNDYTTATLNANVPPASLFSRADTFQSGIPVNFTQGAIPKSVTVDAVAESSLNASANQAISLAYRTSVITVSFVSARTANNFGISLDASDLIRSWTSSGSTGLTSANAQFSWRYRLLNGATVVQDWIPDGVIGTGTETGLNITTESINMNKTSAAAANDPQAAVTASGSLLAHNSTTLAADTLYTIIIEQMCKTISNT